VKGQGHTVTENVSRTVASDHCLLLHNPVLPAAVADMGLHVDMTAYVF